MSNYLGIRRAFVIVLVDTSLALVGLFLRSRFQRKNYSCMLLTRVCGFGVWGGLGAAVLSIVAVNITQSWSLVISLTPSSLSRFPIWYVAEARGGMGSRGIHPEQEAG